MGLIMAAGRIEQEVEAGGRGKGTAGDREPRIGLDGGTRGADQKALNSFLGRHYLFLWKVAVNGYRMDR